MPEFIRTFKNCFVSLKCLGAHRKRFYWTVFVQGCIRNRAGHCADMTQVNPEPNGEQQSMKMNSMWGASRKMLLFAFAEVPLFGREVQVAKLCELQ